MRTPTERRPGPLDGRRTAPAALALLLAIGPAPAAAQLIPIRTVPVSQSHQFDLFPSLTMAMGGVSIAVADSLLDPFTNPAKGARLRATGFFSSPGTYSVSSEAGAGRSLPLGARTTVGSWYAGLALALQQVDPSERLGGPPQILDACPACASEGLDLSREERPGGNSYAFVSLGRELPSRGLSLGGSVFWSGLRAVDGVDLLYAGSARIRQHGRAVDVRLGALKEWDDGRSLEALVLHNRFAMSHDVFYLDAFWDPGTQTTAQRPRLERNLDHTTAWGLHAEYERPLSVEGWRIGWLGTANYKSHPKIPNYEIMNIPRDPGRSAAFNVGVGVARTRDGSVFGLDLIYEPIWSYTWADAESPVETRLGGTIPAGGKTIENRFLFSNALLRMGVGEDLELGGSGTVAGLQLGLTVRSARYRLAQRDNVQVSERGQSEDWVEWTPTWGLALRRPGWEVRYRGLAVNGTGRPGVAPGSFRGGPCAGFCLTGAEASGSNILLAPSGPLTLDPVRVLSHQVSLSLPLH